MFDTLRDWESYEPPSQEILENRREFFGLRRENGEPSDVWLDPIQSRYKLR